MRVYTSHPQQVLMLFLADSATSLMKFDTFDNAIEPLRAFANALHAQRGLKDVSDWCHDAQIANMFNNETLRKLLNELKGKLRTTGPEAMSLIPALPAKGRFSLDLPPTAIVVPD